MQSRVHYYPVLIKEGHLDTFGHVNNAVYLALLEEARWDLLTQNNYGLDKIVATQIGPTILEIKINFLKELKLRDEVIIETQVTSYKKKIGIVQHTIKRGDEICCTAELVMALFDLKQRKLIAPTPDWLKGLGIDEV